MRIRKVKGVETAPFSHFGDQEILETENFYSPPGLAISTDVSCTLVMGMRAYALPTIMTTRNWMRLICSISVQCLCKLTTGEYVVVGYVDTLHVLPREDSCRFG